MLYSDIMSTIATIVAVIAVPATYYNGVRVGKVNDKRKEFNAIADEINLKIRRILREVESGYYPSSSISHDDIDRLLLHIAKEDRESLITTYEQYINIIRQHHRGTYKNTINEEIISELDASLKSLMPFVERK